jgi:multicomponent Na+:H+ antiporter subunit G
VTVRDVVVGVLLVSGTALAVFACLGVVLMREAMDRVHYTAPAALGAAALAGAVLVQGGWSLIGLRAIALAALVLVTAPVLSHATARAIHIEQTEKEQAA